jgi:hypothetical protein
VEVNQIEGQIRLSSARRTAWYVVRSVLGVGAGDQDESEGSIIILVVGRDVALLRSLQRFFHGAHSIRTIDRRNHYF